MLLPGAWPAWELRLAPPHAGVPPPAASARARAPLGVCWAGCAGHAHFCLLLTLVEIRVSELLFLVLHKITTAVPDCMC